MSPQYLPLGPQSFQPGPNPTGPSFAAILLSLAVVCLGGFWIVKAWNGHESSKTAKTSTVSIPDAHSADDLDDVRLHLTHAQNNLTAGTAEAKRIQDRLRQLATTINVTSTESQRNRLRDADNSSQAVLRNLSEALEEIATARERTTKIK